MRQYAIKDNASNCYLRFLNKDYPLEWVGADKPPYFRVTFNTRRKAELALQRVQRRLVLESTNMYSALGHDLEVVEV